MATSKDTSINGKELFNDAKMRISKVEYEVSEIKTKVAVIEVTTNRTGLDILDLKNVLKENYTSLEKRLKEDYSSLKVRLFRWEATIFGLNIGIVMMMIRILMKMSG